MRTIGDTVHLFIHGPIYSVLHRVDTQFKFMNRWFNNWVKELQLQIRHTNAAKKITDTNTHGHHYFLLVTSHLFLILFWEVILGQKCWAFINFMISVKSITNIFRAPIKTRFKKEKKIRMTSQKKRNWKKMSSALLNLMIIYVSHQFPFPPSQGSPFVIVITKGMIACWLTDDPDTACTQALILCSSSLYPCTQ